MIIDRNLKCEISNIKTIFIFLSSNNKIIQTKLGGTI